MSEAARPPARRHAARASPRWVREAIPDLSMVRGGGWPPVAVYLAVWIRGAIPGSLSKISTVFGLDSKFSTGNVHFVWIISTPAFPRPGNGLPPGRMSRCN
jgi:hypothetical protein